MLFPAIKARACHSLKSAGQYLASFDRGFRKFVDVRVDLR